MAVNVLIVFSMKATVEIPDEMIERMKTLTHSHTDEEAVLAAISEFDGQHSLEYAVSRLGTFEDFMTVEDLKTQREQD